MMLIKVILGALFADTYTYWKHRSLHCGALFVFHKDHHTFLNPSTFAGFALHPVEGLATFWPIWLFSIPQLNLWAPLYAGFLIGFGFLNLYLHCGQDVAWLDNILAYVWLNTSRWHNLHHERTVKHFGEVSYFWDLYCGTGGDTRI